MHDSTLQSCRKFGLPEKWARLMKKRPLKGFPSFFLHDNPMRKGFSSFRAKIVFFIRNIPGTLISRFRQTIISPLYTQILVNLRFKRRDASIYARTCRYYFWRPITVSSSANHRPLFCGLNGERRTFQLWETEFFFFRNPNKRTVLKNERNFAESTWIDAETEF